MSDKSNVPLNSYSHLEKVFSELSRLEQEGLAHLADILKTKQEILDALRLAQIKLKVYPEINE